MADYECTHCIHILALNYMSYKSAEINRFTACTIFQSDNELRHKVLELVTD